jgi:hypothetical protein
MSGLLMAYHRRNRSGDLNPDKDSIGTLVLFQRNWRWLSFLGRHFLIMTVCEGCVGNTKLRSTTFGCKSKMAWSGDGARLLQGFIAETCCHCCPAPLCNYSTGKMCKHRIRLEGEMT